LTGFSNIEASKVNVMKAMGATRWEIFRSAVFPNALPQVFIGLKLGCIISTIAAMSSDMSVAQGGLGYRIMMASSFLAMETAFSAILIAALLGMALYQIVSFIESKIIIWN
jgi:ABC-type nitrate/sulfonate/bicarbonate transport system permease component